MDWSFALGYFVGLVGIVNPLAQVPLWVSASLGEPRAVQVRLAIQVVLSAAAILLLFVFLGPYVLTGLGVSLPAFQFGGGVVILLIAVAMLRGEAFRFEDGDEDGISDLKVLTALRFRKIFVPIGVPMIAGPGGITTAILGSTRAGGLVDLLVLGAITAVVMVIVLITLLSAQWLRRLLGELVIEVATRLFGLILAAIAAQFIFDGFGAAYIEWRNQS